MFIALISAYRPILQSGSQDRPIVIDGKTEIVANCPVALSDAKYIFYGPPGQRMKKEKYEVKVQNTSGRDIRKAVIGLRYEDKFGISRTHGATRPIAIGETKTHIFNHSIGYPEGTDKADLVDNSQIA